MGYMQFEFLRAPWMERANCDQDDAHLFFQDDSVSRALALRICEPCKVKAECASYAVDTRSEGIWGGLLPEQLDALRRRRRKA